MIVKYTLVYIFPVVDHGSLAIYLKIFSIFRYKLYQTDVLFLFVSLTIIVIRFVILCIVQKHNILKPVRFKI